MKIHDSFWIDWVWADQFTNQLRQGVLYPRWLPDAHDGLGSPTFYYYPPLAFYLTGVLGLAGLSTYGSIVGAFGLGFLLSGLTMHAWLRDWASRPLVGTLAFMAAPYHLLDFYGRGALAEFVAIGIIPAVALGLRRLAEGLREGLLLTSIAYAALICTHLPLAVLTSLFFALPYALLVARGRPGALMRVCLGLGLGISLSAIYLVPALALAPYRDAAQLWAAASTTAENWSVWAINRPGPAEGMRWMVVKLLLVLTIPAIASTLLWRSGWAAYGALCCGLAAGVIPSFWGLPLLASVQYPFRTFPLAEFATATGLARIQRFNLVASLVLMPALLLSLIFLAAPAPPTTVVTRPMLAARHPEVPENLPPGERPFSWPSRWALELAAAHRKSQVHNGHTIEPVFYFPAWQVQCHGRPVTPQPDPETALLSYAGEGCTRTLGWTNSERIGASVSTLALLLLILIAGSWRRRPTPAPRQAYASN